MSRFQNLQVQLKNHHIGGAGLDRMHFLSPR